MNSDQQENIQTIGKHENNNNQDNNSNNNDSISNEPHDNDSKPKVSRNSHLPKLKTLKGGIEYVMEEGGVPCFSPKWKQFKDFEKFIENIHHEAKDIGLVKVIPPDQWKPKHGIRVADDFKIFHPIRQEVNGSKGIYRIMNIRSCDEMPVSTFREECILTQNKQSTRDKSILEEAIKTDTDEAWKLCAERIWKNITNFSPLYGADSDGTIFDKEEKVWNVNDLPSLLRLLPDMRGVTTSMLYFGQYKSMFAWHVEDMNLYSINFIHEGSPKQWYGIPPRLSSRFFEFCRLNYPMQYRICPEFIRHKDCLITPNLVRSNNIQVVETIHRKGEIMITFPSTYHQGFNYGYNCAESANFAFRYWIPFGEQASKCKCRPNNVHISMNVFKSMVETHESRLSRGLPSNRELVAADNADHEALLMHLDENRGEEEQAVSGGRSMTGRIIEDEDKENTNDGEENDSPGGLNPFVELSDDELDGDLLEFESEVEGSTYVCNYSWCQVKFGSIVKLIKHMADFHSGTGALDDKKSKKTSESPKKASNKNTQRKRKQKPESEASAHSNNPDESSNNNQAEGQVKTEGQEVTAKGASSVPANDDLSKPKMKKKYKKKKKRKNSDEESGENEDDY